MQRNPLFSAGKVSDSTKNILTLKRNFTQFEYQPPATGRGETDPEVNIEEFMNFDAELEESPLDVTLANVESQPMIDLNRWS